MIIPNSQPLMTPQVLERHRRSRPWMPGRVTSTISAPAVPAGIDVNTKSFQRRLAGAAGRPPID